MKNFHSKKGVSLITVLLFMLVATIAATATYKWLSSEGSASAARLRKSEAYQSSQAGLESTRSWMTYHANDVGSLIKQYKENGGKAVYLNPLLKEITRPNQQYDVWLVGVNTEQSTYKVKILSSGRGINGSTYNQVAIFNVDGLYQVSRAKQKEATSVDFEFAYFGGSYTGAGNVSMTSAVVNGNWKGNPQNIQKNFIITGNAELSGNNVNIGNLACVGGDLSIDNQGLTVKDLYVGGASRNSRITASGDVYFNGDVSQGQTGPIVIDGSVTLNGVMRTNQASSSDFVEIRKNLCVDETNGKVVSGGTTSKFEVKGSVLMPGKQNIIAAHSTENCLCEVYWEGMKNGAYVKERQDGTRACNSLSYPYSAGSVVSCNYTFNMFNNEASYNKIILGSSADSKVYVKGLKKSADYNGLRFNIPDNKKKYCPENMRFKFYSDEATWTRPNDWSHYTKKDGGNKNICGTLSATTSYTVSYGYGVYEAIDYTRGWKNWDAGDIQLFTPVTANSDKYVIFSDDVKFMDKDLTDWRVYKTPQNAYVNDNGSKATGITIWNGYIGFNDFFTGTVKIGAFVFGTGPEEKLYYNPTTNTNNFLNYENGSPTGSPYCYNDGTPEGKYRPTCGVTPWFSTSATAANIKNGSGPGQNIGAAEKNQIKCAESLVDRCAEFWGSPTDGCDNSKYKVPDMLVTGKTTFEPFASKGCANDIKQWGPNLANELNECYQENIRNEDKKNTNLYNGYLVVKVQGAQGTQNCPAGDLKGNYIILVDGAPIDCQNGLPTVQDGYRTFLYLNKGADNIGNKTTRNYFIYTRDQIKSAKQLTLYGSIYAEARTCAGMGDLQSSSLNYDPELVSDMVDAGIICQRGDGETPEQAESSCGSNTTSGGGSGSTAGSPSGSTSGTTTVTIENRDSYYISNAATLSISLESQYRSDEELPSTTGSVTAAGDVIVVPRVIYMTRDPYGELSDYYNVIGLNGLKVNRNNGSARCVGPSALRTSGVLYNRGSDEQLTEGEYQCTYSYDNLEVPFFVNVKGQSGTTPFVNFTESSVDMGKSTSYDVKIAVPPHSTPLDIVITKPDNLTNWVITPNGSLGNCAGNSCTFKLQASDSRSEQTVFTVSTSGASNGTAVFSLNAGEGYAIGTPSTITLSYASTVTVSRIEATQNDIATFCNNNSGAGCPADKSNWPNCSPDAAWIVANGDNCVTAETNSRWVCGASSDISLEKITDVPGCITIIPQNVLQSNSFEAGDNLELPATIKAKPMKFKFGFKGQELSGKQITATVVGSTAASRINTVSKTCTYGSDVHSSGSLCEIDVFKGENISLSFTGERPRNFNYWSCEGSSCPQTPYSGASLTGIVITSDGDKAYANFDETDKHCFFDEFKDDGCETEYCFTNPDKWRLINNDFSKVEYHYGHVSVKNNKNDKDGVIVLSQVDPGMSGTLKAQFQVPQISRNASSKVLTTIKNNGFILRSNASVTDYLLLSFYVNNEGYLTASLCTNNGSTCKENRFNMKASSSSVITLTANINTSEIDLFASTSSLGTDLPYRNSFSFINDGFSRYASSGTHIGFRMADPNFVLYDIGWKSEDYGAQCWDTYPTLNCSFRSAYLGGVVPKNDYVKPWVGLSSWFDDKNCEASYYYNGNDACGASNGQYTSCTSSGYSFREEGPHGYKDNSDNEIKTAKAGVLNCYNLEENERELFESERAHCGEFWVGEMNKCSESVELASSPRTIYSGSSESFNLYNGVLNTRDATLNVELENDDASTVEIYLLSQQDNNTNPTYSRSFETTSSGKISITVADLLDAEGFDPEKVSGVTVSVLSGTNVTVKQIYTSCPYVVTLSNCTASFDNDKWNISAYATNYVDVSSFIVTSNWTSQQNYTCSNDGVCHEEGKYSTTASSNAATYNFKIEDNPYENNSEKTYQFNISMSTRSGKTLECQTNEVRISSIKATCGEISDVSVKPGQGLPSFKYTLEACPNNNCPYKITLNELEIAAGNKEISNGKTSINAGNTMTSPLPAGTYKFRLESDDPNLPFEACESSEFTVGNGDSNGDGDDSYNGTICLAGVSQWPEISTEKGSLSKPLTEGKYLINHDCYAAEYGISYFYICTGSVSWGNINLNCDGREHSSAEAVPSTNHEIVIGANGSISKLGCATSRASCSTGYTPGASSSDTPDTPTFDGEKLTCHIENEAGENLGAEAEINLGESFVFVSKYAGQCNYATLEGNGVSNGDLYKCKNDKLTIKPSKKGENTYHYTVSQGYIQDGVEPYAECSLTVTVNSNEDPSIEYNGEICLNGWGPFVNTSIGQGSYHIRHNCELRPHSGNGNNNTMYFYTCTSGANIEVNDVPVTCDGTRHYSTENIGYKIEVVSGSLTEFGCVYSEESCTTGFTAGSSSSGNTGDPETPQVPGEIVGTICLNGVDPNGKWPEISNNLGSGTYSVNHGCTGSFDNYRIYYVCSGNVSWGSHKLNCTNNEVHDDFMPTKADNTLIIGVGSSVTKFGCVGGAATSCETGYTAGASNPETSANVINQITKGETINNPGLYTIKGCHSVHDGFSTTHTESSKNVEIQVNFKSNGSSVRNCIDLISSTTKDFKYDWYWGNGDEECSAALVVDYPYQVEVPTGVTLTMNDCW